MTVERFSFSSFGAPGGRRIYVKLTDYLALQGEHDAMNRRCLRASTNLESLQQKAGDNYDALQRRFDQMESHRNLLLVITKEQQSAMRKLREETVSLADFEKVEDERDARRDELDEANKECEEVINELDVLRAECDALQIDLVKVNEMILNPKKGGV